MYLFLLLLCALPFNTFKAICPSVIVVAKWRIHILVVHYDQLDLFFLIRDEGITFVFPSQEMCQKFFDSREIILFRINLSARIMIRNNNNNNNKKKKQASTKKKLLPKIISNNLRKNTPWETEIFFAVKSCSSTQLKGNFIEKNIFLKKKTTKNTPHLSESGLFSVFSSYHHNGSFAI
eukprot:gene13467-9275_t